MRDSAAGRNPADMTPSALTQAACAAGSPVSQAVTQADADACCTSTNTTGLVHLLVRTVAKSGNLEINFGPAGDGRLPTAMVQPLLGTGPAEQEGLGLPGLGDDAAAHLLVRRRERVAPVLGKDLALDL